MSENDTDLQDPIEPEESGGESLSRRRLVLGGLAAVATVAVSTASLARGSTAAAAQIQSKGVIVSDPSLCVGCLACEVNCSTWHASVGRSSLPRIRIVSDPSVKLAPKDASYLPGRAGNS